MKLVGFLLLLLCVGCGKVSEPLPPFIQIPEAISDLTVRQVADDLIFNWTNPARYIDGSTATDVGQIRIRSNGSIIATVKMEDPAKAQSFVLPIGNLSGQRLFSVQVETSRGKMSAVSNTVEMLPIEVPGKVIGLRATVDQRTITLRWEQPQEHPELADSYVVSRSQPPESHAVTETRYVDTRYQQGSTYTYRVVAMRGTVPGVESDPVTVVVEDTTPPQPPVDLDIVPTENGAFVTWAASPETDLAGYRIFQSEGGIGEFRPVTDRLNTTNAFFDSSYRPGVFYAVSAVDEFGNESARSTPLRAP